MGFDLYGLNRKSENVIDLEDNYFRNNVWWWRRLWDFTCIVCDDIFTDEDVQNGTWNNCYKIPPDKAIAIADRLDLSLQTGVAQAYSKRVQEERRRAKRNNKNRSMSDKEYDWSEGYPFSVQNVREFSKFCRKSGGFEIC